jgi:organic radical activating enzyme
MNEAFMQVPVCIRPWFHFGIGWNTFSACCASYSLDFGNVKDTSYNVHIKKEIFNHESYLYMRKGLLDNMGGGGVELPEPCKTCSQKYGVGSMPQLQEQEIDMLMQIDDNRQRQRAASNYNYAVASIFRKDTIVDYMPVHAVVTCGSACNIKCKFCYNCLMDYNPDPVDILKILDKIHETLIYCQLTGGEPLVTKAGRALLKRFAEGTYKFAVRLGTNAQFVDFDLLRPVNLADVQISTDGATKQVYETVRIGGDFDDLISNVKKFVDLKKEKPFLKISTNFTVTSDNYMDIPEAVKLYEDLGTFTMFGLVMREKDDPQNIKERPDLYEPLLKKLDEGMAVAINPITRDKLTVIKNTILGKMKEKEQ